MWAYLINYDFEDMPSWRSNSVGTIQSQHVWITSVMCAVFWLVPKPLMGRLELWISLLSRKANNGFWLLKPFWSHKSIRILEFPFICVRALKELKWNKFWRYILRSSLKYTWPSWTEPGPERTYELDHLFIFCIFQLWVPQVCRINMIWEGMAGSRGCGWESDQWDPTFISVRHSGPLSQRREFSSF